MENKSDEKYRKIINKLYHHNYYLKKKEKLNLEDKMKLEDKRVKIEIGKFIIEL